MAAKPWRAVFTAGLLTTAAMPAAAQSWNLYSGTTSYYVPFWGYDKSRGTYYRAEMGPDQTGNIPLSLNGGPITLFTMDTGSTGLVSSKNHFPINGLTSLGPGQIVYTSSGDKLIGEYYLTKVNIYDSPTADRARPLTTATVVTLRVDRGECEFTDKGCHPVANPDVAYMGIGFDRPLPGAQHGNTNTFTAIDAPASYSPGYLITNSGVYLGLTNALTANYAFVKLMQKGVENGMPSWLGAPMTIAVGGATGSGSILPDSGINYAFLTAPDGASIPKMSSCPQPPGGKDCAKDGVLVQVYLPGQTSPQIAAYSFTTGGSGNALQPNVVQMAEGPSVFLNSGREFYAGFNYFYDPVNGYVGYQWNGQVPSRYGAVIPIIALKGNVALPASLSSSFPTYLMDSTTLSSPGTVVFQGNLFGPGGLTIAGGDFSLAGPANTYMGGTTVNRGSLSLGPGATLPGGSTLTMNGGTFNLNGNVQVLGSIGGNGGTVNLGNGLLVLETTQANTLGSSLAGNGHPHRPGRRLAQPHRQQHGLRRLDCRQRSRPGRQRHLGRQPLRGAQRRDQRHRHHRRQPVQRRHPVAGQFRRHADGVRQLQQQRRRPDGRRGHGLGPGRSACGRRHGQPAGRHGVRHGGARPHLCADTRPTRSSVPRVG